MTQQHPDMAPFWAATIAALLAKLPHASECTLPTTSPDARPALVLPTLLPLPARHGLPIGQLFADAIHIPQFKQALVAMGLSTIPAWIDHPIVATWFASFSGPTAPPPVHFITGASLVQHIPSALFRSCGATLHDATNKMCHSCVTWLNPKTTRTL
jgi:hypothetical protein